MNNAVGKKWDDGRDFSAVESRIITYLADKKISFPRDLGKTLVIHGTVTGRFPKEDKK